MRAKQGMPEEQIRRENNQIFVDHKSTLGKRRAIAGIEKVLMGVRAGGFRKIRVGPHLADRTRGLPGLIPPDAALDIPVWLVEVVAPDCTAGRRVNWHASFGDSV